MGRFAHYLGGITWIGLLYFFNFIQGSAFGEMGEAARGEALRKITWRTLWWFRWAAALTWVSGIWILGDTMQVCCGAPLIRVSVSTAAVAPKRSHATVAVMTPGPPAVPFTRKNSFCVQTPRPLAQTLCSRSFVGG